MRGRRGRRVCAYAAPVYAAGNRPCMMEADGGAKAACLRPQRLADDADLKSNMTGCPASLSVLPATLPPCPSRAPIETSAEPTRPNRHRSTRHMQERPADARSWLCPPPTCSHTTLFWPVRMASQRVDGMVGLRLPAPPLAATGFGPAARNLLFPPARADRKT